MPEGGQSWFGGVLGTKGCWLGREHYQLQSQLAASASPKPCLPWAPNYTLPSAFAAHRSNCIISLLPAMKDSV